MSDNKILAKLIDNLEYTGVRKKDISTDEYKMHLEKLLSSKSFHPLELGTIFKEDDFIVILSTWDDCNLYQDEGYYINILTQISNHKNNGITITGINELWDVEGNVELKFDLNGKPHTLKFNHLEEHDTVPVVFTDYLKKLLETHSGSSKYIREQREEYDVYYLLPNELVEYLKCNSEINERDYTLQQIKEKNEFNINLNDKVNHPHFGSGVVMSLEEDQNHPRVQVQFDSGDVKWLVLNYANLKVI
jgi:hypothetical protein